MLRPPPDVSLYHRHSNPLFPQTLRHLGGLETVHAVVIPRTEAQRDYVRSLALPSVIVPERAVDAQSLIAFSDLVVSAGGTMNREAAALGVPVYTTYGGRLGGVDEELIRQGRLRPLTDPRALVLEKRVPGAADRTRRDPADLLDAAALGLLCLTDDGEHVGAVALELRRADTRDLGELVPRAGARAGDRGERAVVEHDVGRDLLGLRPLPPPRRERVVQLRVGGSNGLSRGSCRDGHRAPTGSPRRAPRGTGSGRATTSPPGSAVPA